MSRNSLFIGFLVLWVILFGVFVIYQEISAPQTRVSEIKGREVLLDIIPVDPNQLKGDQALMNYEINRIDKSKLSTAREPYQTGNKLFIILKPDEYQIIRVDKVVDAAPNTNEMFLRGQVKSVDDYGIWVEYDGISKYHIPEDKLTEIKNSNGKFQVRVIIDKDGNAVIKDLIPL